MSSPNARVAVNVVSWDAFCTTSNKIMKLCGGINIHIVIMLRLLLQRKKIDSFFCVTVELFFYFFVFFLCDDIK